MSTGSGGGIPGLRGADHIGITVPDLDEAHSFLVDVLGAEPVYSLGEKRADDDWMQRQLGVHPRTVIREIRFYRLGTGLNIETFAYDAADGQSPQPRNSDIGGYHLALYVDDMDAAVEYLRASGVEVMGEPVASRQAALGQRWIYFRSPWGLQFELVSYPDGKAYEAGASRLLWKPTDPAA
ncbi:MULTISPECIES: VOC family protein [Microbacterium]|uniref:VOC family protein n=1 Tax=Microbacterium wangchenii TaxID=2541726 RepID=A0ABX5SUV3_9MICO|nr:MULTISPECIES: VOC family protein [Microbacterium]MCK6067099.1 VOC family protein [Microbacterium sp. EYE_512]QBR89939.1 VOC family protein [Microbacterium wangchenii]TXK16465.1 VOC family protein [Microbacterium wangchenii]